MSKIARVKFIRDKEPNIKALTAENKVLDGALYVATDTGTLWMGISSSSLIQIKDNINTNTTYNLTKSGSTITLRGSDGSTFNVTDSNTVYGNATASAAGLMSAADKAKLDGVAAGSNHVTVDAELSSTSTNPVQNKIIKSALDGKSNTDHTHDDRYYTESEINIKLNAKANSSHTHTKAQITDFPTSMPASDVYSWAKQSSKPSYTISEVSGNLPASRISGTIDAAHLPSYVDDVIEGYLNGGKFYTTKSSSGAYSGEITAEAGKIYVDLSNNKTYRWSGSTYVVISETIALGTTHSSAGYGDESRVAYNHSTKTSGNPHHVTKTDVGLGNVDNTADSAKSVKYATSAGSAGSVAWSNVSGKPSSMPASDVYSWAKQPHKPSYTASEVGAASTDHSHNIIADKGRHVEIASGTTANAPTAGMASASAGLYLTRSYNDTTAPTSYGNILNVVGDGTGQLFMGWSGNDSTSGHLYYRSHRDTSTGGWGNWNTIIDSSNIGSQSVNYANSAGSVAWTNVSGRPSSMPASDVYSWAKASSKPSYSWSEISGKPTIPSVGNGTVTITQNGANKGSFTLNQSGNATIALTDTNINTWRPEEVIVSSSQPSASTCKLWIKV